MQISNSFNKILPNSAIANELKCTSKYISKSEKTKNKIVEKYASAMKEFFELIEQSEIMKELNYPISSLCIGINTIHRVFEYVLIKSKSIDRAYYTAQKTYYYYLEYIEQVYKSNLSQNLNHADAVLFVYKKTIFEMYDGDNNQSSNTMSNIMTLNDETIIMDEAIMRALLLKMSTIINTIFHWKNVDFTFNDRRKICDKYLIHFLKKMEYMDVAMSYMEVILQKFEIGYEQYTCLLNEFLERNYRSVKGKNISISESEKNEIFLIKFYIEDSILREKFENGDLKEFVKWLYLPI